MPVLPSIPAHPPRLLGLVNGDPSSPATSSSVALPLLDAVARRYVLVDRRNVGLTPIQRYGLAAATFHPDRRRWLNRYDWNLTAAVRIRSANAWREVERVSEPFDLALQVYGQFRTLGAPYVLYTDNTVALSRRDYPRWVDVRSRALARLYAWERRLYGDALHVFAAGTPTRDSVTGFYGVPEERVSAVGGGARFPPVAELPRGRREPIVLFVGKEWHRKGGDVLVEAFRAVRAQIPGARLRIVGTEEAPRDEPGVEVLGKVGGRAVLAEVYASARVFCLPSRFDPYAGVVTEAMAFGLPCVVTRVGALDEIVVDGETGLVVPREDPAALARALGALLEDPDRAARMGAAGHARVRTHQNWDAVVQRMAPILERLTAELRDRAGVKDHAASVGVA